MHFGADLSYLWKPIARLESCLLSRQKISVASRRKTSVVASAAAAAMILRDLVLTETREYEKTKNFFIFMCYRIDKNENSNTEPSIEKQPYSRRGVATT